MVIERNSFMRKTLLIIVTILTTFTVMAQLPLKVTVGLPRVLTKRMLNQKDVESLNSANDWGQNNKSDRFWVVWSDRAENTTYNAPSVSSGQKGVLAFNERVRIAEIRNDFAHVYEEAQEHRPYPEIMQATDKGWVPMSHLLLWNSCPANERGILNKALIVVNLSEPIVEKKSLLKVYLNPNKKTNRGYATSGNVRFVMKEDKETGLVLLANGTSLQGATDKVLYGWLNKDSYVMWNQRVCLEPNWDEEKVEYFKSNCENIKVYVKSDLSGSEIIKPLKFGSIENKDGRVIDRYRMPKESYRFPILESNGILDDNVYYINVFTRNGNLAGVENGENSNAIDSLEAAFDEAFLEAKIGKQYVEYIKKTNSIMSAPGYTPKRDKDGHEYWKTVLFISDAELDDLLGRLQGVYKAAKQSDYTNREPMVNAFKGVVKAMIPEITDERLNAMSQEDVMSQIAGLNARTGITSKYTLQQLLNPKVVDNVTYADLIHVFAEKYENLARIKTSNYPFSIVEKEIIYYWIPTEMIP